jgi:uncharacterized protein
MDHFTPGTSLLGGALIGAAASLLLLGCGRIAGISDIVGGLLRSIDAGAVWRVLFLAGLVLGGAILGFAAPGLVQMTAPPPLATVLAGGLLVGFGTSLGRGCTSGHGVCGLSRGSLRSLVATLTFMATGACTVWLVAHLAGGRAQ